jgi:hypothetical protein
VRYHLAMPVDDADRFRKQAKECRQQAEKAISPLDEEAWLRVAGEWIKLAQSAEGPGVRSHAVVPESGTEPTSDPRRLKYCMGKKQIIAELRAMAAKYRGLAHNSDDHEAADGMFKLATELEQQARAGSANYSGDRPNRPLIGSPDIVRFRLDAWTYGLRRALGLITLKAICPLFRVSSFRLGSFF